MLWAKGTDFLLISGCALNGGLPAPLLERA
jgi:hypothetical protein